MNDQIERLVSKYDRGTINRRQLLSGLTALAASPLLVRDMLCTFNIGRNGQHRHSLRVVRGTQKAIDELRQHISS